MKLKQLIFGERSLTKVASIYDTRVSAETAVLRLRQAAGMEASQVKLVGPNDATGGIDAPLSRKLEPEQAGIWRTVLRAHAVTGVLGVVAGALLYLGFSVAGNNSVLSSPMLSLGVMLFFGGIFGLLLGGLLSLRPDHYRVMAKVRHEIKRGHWAVVSHPLNHDQTRLIVDELHHRGAPMVRSF